MKLQKSNRPNKLSFQQLLNNQLLFSSNKSLHLKSDRPCLTLESGRPTGEEQLRPSLSGMSVSSLTESLTTLPPILTSRNTSTSPHAEHLTTGSERWTTNVLASQEPRTTCMKMNSHPTIDLAAKTSSMKTESALPKIR